MAREIANGLVDPLLVISPEFKVILSNHAAEARPEILDLVRYPHTPQLSQESGPEIRSLEFLVEYLRQEGMPLRYALVKASGECFAYYYNLTATPLLKPDGSMAWVVLSFQDCTARVNAERARLRSEAVYRAAIENAAGVPYQLNARTGEYDFFGHGLEPLLGCAAREINLKRFREMVRERVVADPEGPRDPGEYTAAFHRREVQSYRMDVRIGTFDGEDKWLNDCALALWDEATEEMTGTVGILQDITARKRTEETCRQATQTLKGILASATEFAIVTTDRAFRVIQYNPAAERIFALPVEEAIGREVEALNFREGILSCSFREAAEHVLRNGKWHCDSTVREGDGAERSFHAVMMPMQEQGRGCGGFVLFCWETTERARLQSQLWRAQKMQAVGQLAGGVAHDFNNLLQVITGHIEFVQKALPADGIALQDLETARSAAQRATALTRQLLAFGRRQALQRERVDLNRVIVDFMKMLRRMIGEQIELEVVLGQNLGPILADSGQMEQVLLNLCVNARDAMPEGGTIRIKTETIRDAGGDEPGPASHVLLTFSDTGQGMPPEVLEHIFEPFFTTKEQG
jgi:PAS domain S-box-containing protein